jgi:hypothetical protein
MRKLNRTPIVLRAFSHLCWNRVVFIVAITFPLLLPGCDYGTTARLSPDLEQRYTAEGITRKADDLDFRYTRGAGSRSERWENRRASIIVTKSSILIHKNDKVGLDITNRTQRAVAVQRSGGRVRIRTGSGRSEEIWSFEPPGDAEGWTSDIRSVIRASKGGSSR